MKHILLLLTIVPMTSQAAWYVAYPDAANAQKEISDAPYEFKLGDLRCGVSETKFLRAPDDSISQGRDLYCWTAAETYVYASASCLNPPYYSFTTLGIKIGNKNYMPVVVCGPSRKKSNP